MIPLTLKEVCDKILPPDAFKRMTNNERKRRHLPMYRKIIKNRGTYEKWKIKRTNDYVNAWANLFSNIIISKRKYTGVIHLIKEDTQCHGMTRL